MNVMKIPVFRDLSLTKKTSITFNFRHKGSYWNDCSASTWIYWCSFKCQCWQLFFFHKRWGKYLDMLLELVSSSQACLGQQTKLIPCLSSDLAELDVMCWSKLWHLQGIFLLEIVSCSNVTRGTLGITPSLHLAGFPLCTFLQLLE